MATSQARHAGPNLAAKEPWVNRNFPRLLLAIAAAGIIPCLLVASSQFIGYDGWWHLFTATQDRWINFWREWKYDGHPPLHYLALRFVALLGHNRLILRSIGILSGCVSTYAIGLIAAKIYRFKISALLVAAAYCLAWNMILIVCDTRAYPMALMFVLLAFNAWIDLAADPAGLGSGRAISRFGTYSLAGILSEYYVVFFLAGCLGLLAVRFVTQPIFRGEFLRSLRTHWRLYILFMVSIVAVLVILYAVQSGIRVAVPHALDPYLWKEDSPVSLDLFLSSNFEAEMAFFTPLGIDPGVMLAVTGLLIFPALIYFAFLRKERWRASASADTPLMVFFLLAQLVVLSLAAIYPFGAGPRHQSILAPFVFLTAFLALDRFACALTWPWARRALFTASGLFIAANFAFGWAADKGDPVEPRTADYLHFRSVFPAPEAIYSDALSSRFYFAQTHESKWMFQNAVVVHGQYVGHYLVDDGSGHPVRYLRNKSKILFDLADPEMYEVLAATLREEKLHSAVLFYNGTDFTTADAETIEGNARKLAPPAGLEYGRASVGAGYAFIEFRLQF